MQIIRKIYRLDFWLITIFILLIAGASAFTDERIELMAIFALFAFLFYVNRQQFDGAFFIFIIIWVLINFISTIFINPYQPFSIVTVFTRLFLPFIVYAFVKLMGTELFEKLNSYIFYLIIISLAFFLIQLAFPSLIKRLSGVFSFFTNPAYREANGWYAFFFRYTDWHPYRNCGIMWEPGGFAGILIFLLTYQLIKNNFEIDKYVIVYFIAILTTQSTSGYLSLVVVFAAYYIRKRKVNYLMVIMMPIAVIVIFNLYFQLDFIASKLTEYVEVGTDSWGVMDDGVLRTTRLGYAIIILEESIHWPFGHGMIEHSAYKIEKYGKIYGPGTLADILHHWGWIGIFFTVFFIYRFYRKYESSLISVTLSASFLIVLFSNPTSFLLLIYAIIFYVVISEQPSIEKHAAIT